MNGSLWYVVVYSILIGAFMIGWWSFALSRRLVPEVAAGSRVDNRAPVQAPGPIAAAAKAG